MAQTQRFVNDAGSGAADGTSEANAMSYATFTDYMVTGGSFTAAAGDVFNIKGAITARTTTVDTWLNGGTVTSPVVIRGYNSTIGDLTTLARTNVNGPLNTTDYPTISYTTGNITISGACIIIEALKITGANVAGSVGVVHPTGADIYIKRCFISNSAINANSCAIVVGSTSSRAGIIDSDVSLTGGSGALAAIDLQAAGKVIGCRVTGGPAVGIKTAASPVIAFSTIYSSTGNNILVNSVSGAAVILYNTIVGGGADGINFVTGQTTTSIVTGNMITDNTSNGLNMVSTANAAYISHNRFRDNGTNIANGGDWITATSYGQVTSGNGTSDYTNAAGGDYSLISTSPAKAAGSPKYLDIGALQRQEPSASAGGGFFIQ